MKGVSSLRLTKCCLRSTRKKLRRRLRSNFAFTGDLIDLTQEHDPQDILRAAVQENVKRVVSTTVGRVIFNDSIPAGLAVLQWHDEEEGPSVARELFAHSSGTRDDRQDA